MLDKRQANQFLWQTFEEIVWNILLQRIHMDFDLEMEEAPAAEDEASRLILGYHKILVVNDAPWIFSGVVKIDFDQDIVAAEGLYNLAIDYAADIESEFLEFQTKLKRNTKPTIRRRVKH